MEENVALDSEKQKKFNKSIRGIKKILKKSDGKPAINRTANKRIGKKERRSRGLVYLSHIPHGFYEHQMTQYFSQFGGVTNARVIRSKNTGRSKGYAFVEFREPAVAEIVAETMNNYLMGKRLIKAVCIPPEKQRRKALRMYWNPTNNPANDLRLSLKKAYNADKDVAEHLKKAKKILSNLNKTKKKLKELGIDYDFFTPVDLPESLKNSIKSEDKKIAVKKENQKKEPEDKVKSEDQVKQEGKQKKNDKKVKDLKLNGKESLETKPKRKSEDKINIDGQKNKSKVDSKSNLTKVEGPKNTKQNVKGNKINIKPLEEFINIQNESDSDNSSIEFDSDEYEKMMKDDEELDESEDSHEENESDKSGDEQENETSEEDDFESEAEDEGSAQNIKNASLSKKNKKEPSQPPTGKNNAKFQRNLKRKQPAQVPAPKDSFDGKNKKNKKQNNKNTSNNVGGNENKNKKKKQYQRNK